MRLAILSDFHLAPPPLNRCTTPPERLRALIATLKAQCDQVILAGDTFDLLRPASWRAWRAHWLAVASQWPGLAAEIEGCTSIFGNHDVPLGAQGMPEALRFEAGWGSVLITHGHQSDPWFKKIWGLQEGANFVAGHLERQGLAPLSLAMGQVPQLLDGVGRGREGKITPRIERYAQAQPAQVVMCGHTHGLGMTPMDRGSRLFVNTGSHAHGHEDWVVMDLEVPQVELWRSEVLVARATRTSECWQVRAVYNKNRAVQAASRDEFQRRAK